MITFICTMVEDQDDQSFMIDLYHNYKKLMISTAGKYVADISACEDIVQDSVVKLIQHISVIRKKDRCVLTSYIVSTVRNSAIDYLRKQGRAEKYFVNADIDGESAEDSEMLSLDDYLAVKERQTKLFDIWPELSEADQTALRAKYILEYSDAEIAAFLGCKEASVRTRLSRARKRAFLLLSQSKEMGECI